ncbi:MAG: 7-carboxy-7-deazaguanine synthase QueE [Bacteroidales bacterium]|jgi:7-carboxy-7-deazaguanine synthase|nr:7-carboxy-7-deazaguanine synthase QueE [Bacteroidales bacterium]
MSDEISEQLLLEGKCLPLMEEFYTIQGEGYNTGQAAYFVRIGGCDVGCHWCDVKESWNAKLFPPTQTDSIVANASNFPAKSVVVTGGEPLMYNLNYFCSELKKEGIQRFIETSGAYKLSGEWEWICLSPKKNSPPLKPIYNMANELKVIIANKGDLNWAEKNAKLVNENCQLYLQPEWSKVELMMPLITEYVMANPKWKISLQSHKYMNIP